MAELPRNGPRVDGYFSHCTARPRTCPSDAFPTNNPNGCDRTPTTHQPNNRTMSPRRGRHARPALGCCGAGFLLLRLSSPALAVGFLPATTYQIGGDVSPEADAIGDFNGDGIDDFAIFQEYTLKVLLGGPRQPGEDNWDGAASFAYSWPILGLVAGDFDGDGTDDLALRSHYYGRVEVFLSLPAATAAGGVYALESATTFTTTSSLYSQGAELQALDYDGDGCPDIVVGSAVYLSDCTGTGFAGGTPVPADAPLGDVNGDGIGDLIKDTGEVLCGDGVGGFAACAQAAVSGSLFAAADLNGDGSLEIVSWAPASYGTEQRTHTTNHCGRGRTYRKRSGSRYVQRGAQYRRTTGCSWSQTMTVSVVETSALVVSTVAADGTVTAWTSVAVPGVVGDIQCADFNGDGAADVLATTGVGATYLLLGAGDGTFDAPESVGATGTASKLMVGDWDGDGAADLAWFVNSPVDGVDTELASALGVPATTTTTTTTTTADTTKPTVVVGSPAAGATVSGVVAVRADVSDDGSGVAKAIFKVGRKKLGSDKAAPYSVQWDTTTVSDGQHKLKCIARDKAGNKRAKAWTVTVDNSAPATTTTVPGATTTGPSGGDGGGGGEEVEGEGGVAVVGDGFVELDTGMVLRYDFSTTVKFNDVAGFAVGLGVQYKGVVQHDEAVLASDIEVN